MKHSVKGGERGSPPQCHCFPRWKAGEAICCTAKAEIVPPGGIVSLLAMREGDVRTQYHVAPIALDFRGVTEPLQAHVTIHLQVGDTDLG
jgi:hypothetical protein